MMRTLVILLLARACAQGQDLCRNGLFADDQAGLRPARVTGVDLAAFYRDSTPGCPQKGPECRQSGVLAPGAEVLVGKVSNGFACVWQSHDAVGWVPVARVDLSVPFDRTPPISAWAGDWKFFDNHVEIAVAPDGRRLHVNGHAFWHGMSTTHEGTVEGEAAPAGNHAVFQVAGTKCELRLALVNRQLAVTDNRVCGGMNVTFSGIYEQAHQPFQAQSVSTMQYGRNSDGQDTLDIANVTFDLAQIGQDRRLILRKTHTGHNVIGDQGDDSKITVEAWPLGVNLKEKPLYRVTLDGEDAVAVDSALLVFDRTQEIAWWSVYRLDTGTHFFDTNTPLLRFSERYAGLEISSDDTRDQRLKARGVVGVLTYASGSRVIREALITCDSAERAEVLHSLADTTFELAYVAKAIRITLTPFRSPATAITVPVVNDDLDLAHARIPVGMRMAAWKR